MGGYRVMEFCDDCGQPVEFTGYEYWETDENDVPIALDHLVTDNPELTVEGACYYCKACDTPWIVILNANGTVMDMSGLNQLVTDVDTGLYKEYATMDEFIADMGIDG